MTMSVFFRILMVYIETIYAHYRRNITIIIKGVGICER